MTTDPKATYIALHKKSKTTCLILTVLFGPLGLLYSGSWVAAILLTVMAGSLFGTIIVPIICWLISVIYGFTAVDKYNARLSATVDLMQSRSNHDE